MKDLLFSLAVAGALTLIAAIGLSVMINLDNLGYLPRHPAPIVRGHHD